MEDFGEKILKKGPGFMGKYGDQAAFLVFVLYSIYANTLTFVTLL
jgi:hypothetical protein